MGFIFSEIERTNLLKAAVDIDNVRGNVRWITSLETANLTAIPSNHRKIGTILKVGDENYYAYKANATDTETWGTVDNWIRLLNEDDLLEGGSGDSAYQLWSETTEGDPQAFLDSLVGDSAFDTWLALNPEAGGEGDFIEAISGTNIITNNSDEPDAGIGNVGDLHFNTETHILKRKNAEGAWDVLSDLTGPAGPSAFDTWKALENEGTEVDFIASLANGGQIGGHRSIQTLEELYAIPFNLRRKGMTVHVMDTNNTYELLLAVLTAATAEENWNLVWGEAKGKIQHCIDTLTTELDTIT
jgi:hypothetical protein